MYLSIVEVGEELDDAWERLGGREDLGLETGDLEGVLLCVHWQLSPLVEDGLALWCRATLKLSLYAPWDWTLAVSLENSVHTFGVLVLGIEEKSVHVEETRSDSRKAVRNTY